MASAGLAAEPTVLFKPTTSKSFRLRIVESRNEGIVGQEFRQDEACLIGRADECNIIVPDTSISRKHARIDPTPAGFLLTDLKSGNGTWIGDRRVSETLLENLDHFRVGNTVFEFLRDDDEAGDDMDAVRTTAIPVADMMNSIILRIGKSKEVPLEEEGQLLSVAGNKPFLIGDASAMWIVEEGRIDLFTVAIKDGESSGARQYFTGIEPGHAFFGMDFEGYALGSGFLASGKPGTRIRKLSIPRVQELVNLGKHSDRVSGMLDTWCIALAKALMRDVPAGPRMDLDLEPGVEVQLDFQKRARVRKGVVWPRLESGDVVFCGLSEVGFEERAVLFPVSADGWVESTVNELKILPVKTADAVKKKELWDGLQAFHRVLCESEFINKKLAFVDEFQRLKSKAQMIEAAREAAYEDIGAVLAAPGKKKERVETDTEPIFNACKFVCNALGMVCTKPADLRSEASFEDNLLAIATASRFRFRTVALRGDWWHHDQGPILAKIEQTKEAVALLPTSGSSYDWVDGKGKRSPVTPEFAATLDPFGACFYRPFPSGPLSAKQVMVFGARGLKPEVLRLAGMGVLMGILGAMTPYFSGKLFDTAIPQSEKGLLYQFCFALFIFAIATSAFKFVQSIASLRLQGKMDYAIQAALWDRLLDLPSTFFRKFSAGDLADRAMGIDHIRQLLAGAGVSAILGSLSSLFYVGIMFMYSVTLAALGIVLTVIFVVVSFLCNYAQLRYQRDQLDLTGKLTGIVLQLISGVGKMRVSGAEDHGFKVWAREFAESRRIGYRVGTIQNYLQVFNSGFPILASMAIFTTLVFVQQSDAQKGIQGSISTGEFIAFNAAFGAFIGAMSALSDASLNLLKAVPTWERLKPIITAAPESDESKAAPAALKGEIEVSNVWFRYTEESPYILKGISLKIEAGEAVALVGGSGSGKSTLMRCMLGFEKPEKGTIYYDGQDLSTLDVRLVRQQMGVVLQESRLLPSDVYRNIVGNTSKTIDEAWEAAEAAGFAEDIRNMPMGMHTYVPEGGGGFSGGQKQRLMIARAIVAKPRIMFLDEATSALDNNTQAIVTKSLEKMRATRVAIAHRLSTIINYDKICYLEQGVLKEMGPYKELMAKKGLFYQLASAQEV